VLNDKCLRATGDVSGILSGCSFILNRINPSIGGFRKAWEGIRKNGMKSLGGLLLMGDICLVNR
jgi:hypothetical protein